MSEQEPEGGQVVTFYSFKGGVGRSRAVANTAYQLARAGNKVLCVDFDLEAPGLWTYFRPWMKGSRRELEGRPGLIELFCSYRDYLLLSNPFRKIIDWKTLLQRVEVSNEESAFSFDLIGPGVQSPDYGERVTGFDWKSFYEHWEGGRFIEYLRAQFRGEYDYVLIDSRTGVSDTGGICTIQFPTILVLVFSSSSQSTEGLKKIVDNIEAQHKILRGGDRPLPVIPLPARIDRKEEKGEYDSWFAEMAGSRIGLLLDPLRGDEAAAAILQRITIEYFPWYSYRDELESHHDSLSDVGANAWKFNNLVNLIAKAGAMVGGGRRRGAGDIPWERLAGEQNKISDHVENILLARPPKLDITAAARELTILVEKPVELTALAEKSIETKISELIKNLR